MTSPVHALIADAPRVPARERGELGALIRSARPAGSVLVETCHRVELFGPVSSLAEVVVPADLPGIRHLDDDDAARHLVSLAVGRESTVLGEDQILHQLRRSVAAARGAGPLAPRLDHLVDLSLRAGRVARSWFPGRRRSLADVAVEAGLGLGTERGARGRGADQAGLVLVVGSGEMATLAARALHRRGVAVVVASRSADRAAVLAELVDGRSVPLDPPGDTLASVTGVVVALGGAWPLRDDGIETLVGAGAWIVDLSAPPAAPAGLAERLGPRAIGIDDLALRPGAAHPAKLVRRLDSLVESTLATYRAWVAEEPRRSAARALTERAQAARHAELGALWAQVPSIDPLQRAEVEAMTERLVARLLRDPLERLDRDDDGRRREAVVDLFGL